MSGATNTQRYYTKSHFEDLYGYSRGVRKGPFIFISGTTSGSTVPTPPLSITPTTPTPPTTQVVVLHPDSAYNQALHIFRSIIASVEFLGGKRTDITRVKIYVGDEQDGNDVGKALKETLGEDVLPAASMVFGFGFVHPDMKVEVEADAVVLN